MNWNDNVRLIITDVDETVAALEQPTQPAMVHELNTLLREGKAIFFLSGGQGLHNIQKRVTDLLQPELRHNVVIGHCNGAEVCGFDSSGNLLNQPFFSIPTEALSGAQQKRWRSIVQQVVEEFQLSTHTPMPFLEFSRTTHGNPLAVILDDRIVQITLEVVNGSDLAQERAEALFQTVPATRGATDLRIPLVCRAEQLFSKHGLPIISRLAGTFAIDFAYRGVSKTRAIQLVLENPLILSSVGLAQHDIDDPSCYEVWGDRFSLLRNGTDRHMSEALPKEVRSIDFRKEDPTEFPQGYNIMAWDGKKYLHEGLLEYLQTHFTL